jgi:VWFA-related protein
MPAFEPAIDRASRPSPLTALGAVSTLILVTLAPLAAQKRFEETTDVVVVEIPVEVTRDGQPVRGLTAADFEVLDGRKKQEIVGFEVVDLAVEPDAEEIPVAGRRHFLLLFDLALSYPGAIVRSRDAARQLVETALHPSDLVGVAVYTASSGAQLLLGFTSDRDQVAVAIDTLGLPQFVQAKPDPLGLIFADREAFPEYFVGAGGTPAGGGGSGGRAAQAAAEIRETLERIESAASIARERNTVLALTSSLTQLAGMMGSIEGRKHVVFLSEGFEGSAVLGTGVSTELEQRQVQAQAEAAASGEYWRVNGDTRFGSGATLSQLDMMAEEFVRSGCTIQAVDIGGLRAGGDGRPRRSSDDGLFMMADKTGGEHYRNFNDLSAAMGKMLQRTSVTYLLAIQPQNLKRDGEYHRLKVNVAGKGMQVNYRPGYHAPRPFAEQSVAERRFATAGLVLGGADGGAIDTSVLATPFLVSPSQAYVPVLLEIDGPSLLAGHRGNVLPAEIYVYALGEDGSVYDYFTQSMGLDLSKAGEALRGSGFKFWGYVELPPGEYTVRSVVRNASTGAVGVRSAQVKVPAVDRYEAALLPPLFPEPMGKWLIGKQQGADDAGYDYPFVMRDQAFVPAARPVLHSGQTSEVSLVAYNLAAGALEVTARLLGADGGSAGEVQVAFDSRSPGAFAGQERLVAQMLAPQVGNGRYTLEVTVADPSGAAQRSTIPVVVEG